MTSPVGEAQLAVKEFLAGDTFTIADCPAPPGRPAEFDRCHQRPPGARVSSE